MYPTAHIWSDATWNPVGGCTALSIGCRFCYAAALVATRDTVAGTTLQRATTEWHGNRPVFNGTLTALEAGHDSWTWPLRWEGADRPLLGAGQPSLIFACDMSDLFHEQRPTALIDRVVSTAGASPHITQLLTKRPHIVAAYFAQQSPHTLRRWLPKLWLGFSAERQQEFDARWYHARELAARGWTVFVSAAPLLAPIVLPDDFLILGNRAQVICSGEQARGARRTDPAWMRALRDQCVQADVAFFLRMMTGREPIPPDLFIREFPRHHAG